MSIMLARPALPPDTVLQRGIHQTTFCIYASSTRYAPETLCLAGAVWSNWFRERRRGAKAGEII